MHSSLVIAVIAVALAWTTGGAAQPAAAAEIVAIRAELEALQARLERLEQGNPPRAVAAPAAAPAAAPPVEVRVATVAPAVRFEGDLRYRHETIDEEGAVESNRQRIRARFGVAADVASNVRVGLQLASGGADPVSANQTLDTGFDRKPLGIDRAFFSWAPSEQLTLTGGKFANPFFRPGNHHLVYDNDLNPEGLALRYQRGAWFANYGGLWVEERSAADDSLLLGGQFGIRHTFGNGSRLTAGASYYDYLETEGRTPFSDGAAAGNRLSPDGNYLHDFNIAELFAELNLQAGGRPLTVFADYVRNSEAQEADTGFALGARVGEVSGARTWRIGYAYQDLEADAVIGTFTDSDFAGGGTGGKGHVFELDYGLRDRLVLGVRYFRTERGVELGAKHGYNRFQADVMFSY